MDGPPRFRGNHKFLKEAPSPAAVAWMPRKLSAAGSDSLDLIRAVAACAVMVGHLRALFSALSLAALLSFHARSPCAIAANPATPSYCRLRRRYKFSVCLVGFDGDGSQHRLCERFGQTHLIAATIRRP